MSGSKSKNAEMQFMPKSASLNKCRDMELTNAVAVHSHMLGRNIWIAKSVCPILKICIKETDFSDFKGQIVSKLDLGIN